MSAPDMSSVRRPRTLEMRSLIERSPTAARLIPFPESHRNPFPVLVTQQRARGELRGVTIPGDVTRPFQG